MKYVDTQVVFEEIPDEITLCVNISNCGFHCPECHSKHLWDDIGDELDKVSIDKLLSKNKGISCICFMGHGKPSGWIEMKEFAKYIKEKYKDMKVALFSGNNELPLNELQEFDYIKTGPYNPELGPLNSPTTNQRMFKHVGENKWEDITKYYQTKK